MSTAPLGCFDVAVIGAGPAGASAALTLAQSGHSVLLLEKAELPRYKTCGGGVLARAINWLPPEVQNVVECNFNSVALNFPGSGMSFTVSRPKPIVHMTMRADLDCLLARKAQQAGVQLIESCKVKHIATLDGFVEITSNRDTCRAKFIIAADGVHSNIAKAAGWPDLPLLAPALEHEIYLPDKDAVRFSQMPRFDFNIIDAGYAWVFPKRAHLSVGILSTDRICPDLQLNLAKYLEQLGITRIDRVERHGYLIPLAPRRSPLARRRVLLVGDAAGLVDPVTAEGISHAILSGRLAAAAIIESKLDPARTCSLYQSHLEDQILGELRAARLLARILYRHPRVRDAIFRRHGQALCEFVTRVITGEGSYARAMKQPASYLKLLGLWPAHV